VLEDKMMAAAFQWHNYGKSTIGSRSDIERVPSAACALSIASTTSPTTPS